MTAEIYPLEKIVINDDEIQYEMKRANHWATIGIGAKGYYKN